MKQRLLVVDDDPSVLESLMKLLAAEGYDVRGARDGAEALSRFKSGSIDLVVLDLNLGTDDGWELFGRMTALDPFVPTVIITAESGQKDRAIEAGVEALIEKPIDVPMFLQILRNLLTERSQQRRERICGSDDYCRYVPRSYETFLKMLHERRSAPLHLSSERGPTAKVSGAARAVTGAGRELSVVAGSSWGTLQRAGAKA